MLLRHVCPIWHADAGWWWATVRGLDTTQLTQLYLIELAARLGEVTDGDVSDQVRSEAFPPPLAHLRMRFCSAAEPACS